MNAIDKLADIALDAMEKGLNLRQKGLCTCRYDKDAARKHLIRALKEKGVEGNVWRPDKFTRDQSAAYNFLTLAEIEEGRKLAAEEGLEWEWDDEDHNPAVLFIDD